MSKMDRDIIKGEEIVCESSSNEGEGHAGMIFKKAAEGKKVLLGKTDPIFKTAEEAKNAVEKAVEGVRTKGSKPIFKKAEPKNPKGAGKDASKKSTKKEEEGSGDGK